VKVLLIRERIEGFFLSRLTDRGEPTGETQHDTLDEAMSQGYSEYDITGWKFCPDDVDPWNTSAGYPYLARRVKSHSGAAAASRRPKDRRSGT
jgi:hypothetical protein